MGYCSLQYPAELTCASGVIMPQFSARRLHSNVAAGDRDLSSYPVLGEAAAQVQGGHHRICRSWKLMAADAGSSLSGISGDPIVFFLST